MAHHVEARYVEDEQLFLPPLRTLGFNPQLKVNDSLLAQSYIEAYDISYPEALRRIADEVEELKQIMAEQGTYEMNDIGRIYLNDDGHYEFEPCEAGILTPQLYGLSSFEMEPFKKRVLVQKEEQQPTAQVVAMDQPKADTEDTDAEDLQEEAEEQAEKTISIKVSTLRNIAAACVAVIAILLFPHQVNVSENNAGGKINTEVIRQMMPKNITTPDKKEAVAKVQAEAKPSQQQPAAVKAKEQPAAPVQTEQKPEKVFTIVLASQVSMKNATNFVDKLHADGHASARIVKTGKTTRVVYGTYATEEKAYEALRPLRNSNRDFADGWVMKMKNQAES